MIVNASRLLGLVITYYILCISYINKKRKDKHLLPSDDKVNLVGHDCLEPLSFSHIFPSLIGPTRLKIQSLLFFFLTILFPNTAQTNFLLQAILSFPYLRVTKSKTFFNIIIADIAQTDWTQAVQSPCNFIRFRILPVITWIHTLISSLFI